MSLKTDRHGERSESQPDEGPLLEEFCRNELFDLMGNRRRRYALYYLARRDGPVECRELAQQIAAWENDSPREEVTSSQYQSVYNSLYQTHFPELAAAGFIDYDRPEGVVRPEDRIAEVERYLPARRDGYLDPSIDSRVALSGGVLFGGGAIGMFVLVPDLAPYCLSGAALVVLVAIVIGGVVR